MASPVAFDAIAEYVEDCFIHFEGTLEPGIAHAIVSADSCHWFVVEAFDKHNELQMSVLSGEELLAMLAGHQRGIQAQKTDDEMLASALRNVQPSFELDASKVLSTELPSWVENVPAMGQRTVIVDGGVPVGVVDAPTQPRRGPRWLSTEERLRRDPVAEPGDAKVPNNLGADPSKDRIQQHLLAETVSQLRLNDANELLVTVSGFAERGTLENQDAATLLVDSDADLMIIVRSQGSVQLDEGWQASVSVQGVNESTTKKFSYRSTRTGVGSLSVSLFNRSEEIATVQLNILVAGEPRTDSNSQWDAAVTTIGPRGTARNTLVVDKADESTLVFHLVLPSTGDTWHRDETSLRRKGQAAERFLQAFESVRGTRRSFENHQQAEMVGLGEMLADLLPAAIKDPLWEQRDSGHGIELLSTLAKWPWEMCCLANSSGELPTERPFLSERGLTRRRPGTSHPLEINLGRQRVVSAPDYMMMRAMNLRAGAEESAFLQNDHGFAAGPTTTSNLTALLNEGEFSVFHFAGHSVIPRKEDGGLGLPKLVLNDSKFAATGQDEVRSGLSPTMLRRRSLQDTGPLVFLNACATGGLYDAPPGVDAVRGFPDGFLAAGAGAVIGTHWEVEDEPAKRFAELFYEEFLWNGKTLSDAVSLARTSSGPGWSPSPLAYVAYGHPDAKAVM